MRAEASWRLLGIAPTGDTREIRRAYARRLKTIDVDADPEGFGALRYAFEHATLLAAQGDILEESAEAPIDWTTEDDRWATDAEPDPPAVEQDPPAEPVRRGREPWLDRSIDAANMHAAALERLLSAHQNAHHFALADESDAMMEHWRAIMADSRLANLDHFDQVERWISELIAFSTPFSDPLVPAAIDRFGWNAASASLSKTAAVRLILRRRESLVFLHSISNKKHSLHRAWVELTTPAAEGSRRGWRTTRRSIDRLLGIIRRDHPELEQYFDTWRVALWENKQAIFNWRTAAFWAFLAFNALHLFLPDEKSTVAPPSLVATPTNRLSIAKDDIDRAILAISSNYVSVDRVKAENPELFNSLVGIWNSVYERNGDQSDFRAAVLNHIDARFRRVLSRASETELVKYRNVELSEGEFFRDQGTAACDKFFSGDMTNLAPLPETLLDRHRRAVFDIILSTGGDRPGYVPDTRVRIPPTVVGKAATAAGLNRVQFSQAMHAKGTAEQRCAARLAFYRTVLGLPRDERMSILANM